ncbi:hypothetical protein [Streptomyces sp. NPDC015350]|uniref:hypothetical protein n=1 Tax=Streptomyces sp. NPDC015350 TaxID=3364955 RepID=UPI0036F70F19
MNAETAHTISPSSEEAWRLVGHYLHRLSHDLPEEWRLRDHEASQCRERVWSLPTENGNDAQVALWLRLSDTEVPCDDPGCAAREMYLTSDGSGSVPASGPLPAFARREGLGYFEYWTHPHHGGWACDGAGPVRRVHGQLVRQRRGLDGSGALPVGGLRPPGP